MRLLKENFGVKSKESLNNSSLGNISYLLKWYGSGIFSRQWIGNAPGNSNHVALETDAFAKLRKLKLLQLSYVQARGSYEKFPKELRWLCWDGFPLQSIPNDFPMERLVVLEMRCSSLKEVFNGTKFLKLLKIIDLSDSGCLAKTPDFSMLPILERLILANCVNLVEVHESIGSLQRLVLLNLRGCKNLWNLPRSIVSLRCLEMLDISGCSNLRNAPTEFPKMESLTVLYADEINVCQSLSISEEVQTGYSLVRWLLKPRKSPEHSWASLPHSLVKLSLVNCNLSEDDFPNDIGNLSSLRKLNLSNNPICSLPDCIRDLAGLEILLLESCTGLRSLEGLHDELKFLRVGECNLLEKVRFLSPRRHRRLGYTYCENLDEIEGVYKLEPIENVDTEILDNLGLPNLESLQGKPNVKLLTDLSSEYKSRNRSLLGCHERDVFNAYVPGSKVPDWFNIKNMGSSISFTVPSHPNFRIHALSVCSVYGFSDRSFDSFLHIIVSNTTTSVMWSYCPYVFGIPEDKEDTMLWLSYWRFEGPLGVGDKLNISVAGTEHFEVKEVGVRLVFEKEKTTSQSTSTDEEIAQESRIYGKAIPGSVGGKYILGLHRKDCRPCPEGDFIRLCSARRIGADVPWPSV